jgi:hypothetical protein
MLNTNNFLHMFSLQPYILVQASIQVRETQVLKVWASEAKQLVLLNEDESQKRDQEEFAAMSKQSEEQRQRILVGNLNFDCLACVINPKERRKAIARHRKLKATVEHSLLSGIQSERRLTARELQERHITRRADIHETLKEGGQLLERLGGTNCFFTKHFKCVYEH